jgi:hypothetical protein
MRQAVDLLEEGVDFVIFDMCELLDYFFIGEADGFSSSWK